MKTSLRVFLIILWFIVGSFALTWGWFYFWNERLVDIFPFHPFFIVNGIRSLTSGMAYEDILIAETIGLAFFYILIFSAIVFVVWKIIKRFRAKSAA